MTEAALRAEIEALRSEIAAIRAERREPDGDVKTEPAAEPAAATFAEQLRLLAHEISAFAENTEEGVANHPLTSVLGALVLGILIGRVIRR